MHFFCICIARENHPPTNDKICDHSLSGEFYIILLNCTLGLRTTASRWTGGRWGCCCTRCWPAGLPSTSSGRPTTQTKTQRTISSRSVEYLVFYLSINQSINRPYICHQVNFSLLSQTLTKSIPRNVGRNVTNYFLNNRQ